MEATDQVLVRRLARQGDQEAFCALLTRYADMVYSTSLRILRDNALASDVTQETFFQLFKSAGRITGSAGGWLHQVATRRAIDLVRQNVARRRREHSYALEQDGPTTSWAEVAPLIDGALEELPDEHREMLIQHFLERKSMGQIAAARGISQPTVSRRVAEGLELVRQGLRSKGYVIGVVPLQTLLVHTAEAAPESLLQGLGKIALAQAAGAQATAAGSLLGSTGALAFTGAAAVVAVIFNVLLPEPQWGPTQPLPRPNRSQAQAAMANTASPIKNSATVQVKTESRPAAPATVSATTAASYAINRPVLLVRSTNAPLATNSPPAQAAQTATAPGRPTPQLAASPPLMQPNILPANSYRSLQVWNQPMIRPQAQASAFQVDRQRTNSARPLAVTRTQGFQRTAVLGPRSGGTAPRAPTAPTAPKDPKRKGG